MRIVIKGTNNVNKGAELMFCAICQELENRYPYSSVYISELKTDSPYISKSLSINPRKHKQILRFSSRLHLYGLLRRLGFNLRFLNIMDYCPADTDFYFNAGGYAVGDVWNHSEKSNKAMESYFSYLRKNNVKIVYLPQAFGPFEKESSKNAAKIILKYADIVYAREEKSFEYLQSIGGRNSNLKIAPDFTTLIKGVYPKGLEDYSDAIVIIPNKRMLLETAVVIEDYVNLIIDVMPIADKLQKKLVILNHEGPSDLDICKEINEKCDNRLKIVDGLPALEIKGFIESSYAVISSRFHGTASSLSSAVPCLSSSWSPKYELLYADYGLDDMIVDLKNRTDTIRRVSAILNPIDNANLRNILVERVKHIKELNKNMWNEIYR